MLFSLYFNISRCLIPPIWTSHTWRYLLNRYEIGSMQISYTRIKLYILWIVSTSLLVHIVDQSLIRYSLEDLQNQKHLNQLAFFSPTLYNLRHSPQNHRQCRFTVFLFPSFLQGIAALCLINQIIYVQCIFVYIYCNFRLCKC